MKGNGRFWIILGVLVVLVVLLVGGSGGEGPPYDPRSVSPDGAKGVVETLERLGVDVQLGQPVPRDGDTTALLLTDRLRPDDRDALNQWVDDGGVLVVADPFSRFIARRAGTVLDTASADVCTMEALRDVNELRFPSGTRLDTNGSPSCFGDGNAALVVAQPQGAGHIVSVGARDIFTNAWIDEDDAAVLASSLLAPGGDSTSMTFIGPSIIAIDGDDADALIAPRVWNSIWMLAAAFILYALHRGRRLGRVVSEPLPVHLQGSELVLRAGVLSERAKDPATAAASLRNDLLGRVRRRLGTSLSGDDDETIALIAARLEADPLDTAAVFARSVDSEDALVSVASELSQIDHALFDLDKELL